MARCDDCLANKVCDHNQFGFENCGNFISTDVVPKSEVEQLEKEIEILRAKDKVNNRIGEDYIKVCKKYKALKDSRQEVAREIFEEIEKIILDNTYPDFNSKHKPVNIWKATTGYDAFYELKKKYTGEK